MMIYDRLNHIVLGVERRLGAIGAMAAIAFGLLVAASVYVRPAVATVALGRHYAHLSEDFFGNFISSVVSHRFLTPLISYLLGLRGELIIVTNLIFALLLLALVYGYFRKHAPQPGDALLAVIVIAFSLTTLTTIYYGGYTDSLTYVLIFAVWWRRRQRSLFYLFFFLGLLNRESIAFLVPWFAYVRLMESDNRKWEALELVLSFAFALGGYYLLREWMAVYSVEGFSARFYLEPLLQDPLHWIRQSYKCWAVGLFTIFKALWIFPLMAAVSMWRNGNYRDLFSMFLLMTCASLQLVIAFDTSRMLTMAFPVMILSLVHLMKHNPMRFRERAGWILILNLLIPQLYTAKNLIVFVHSLPVNTVLMLFFEKRAW